MLEIKNITERQIALLDQDNTNGEGWDFYCNGQIVHASVFNDEISGIVQDFVESFQVNIKFREHEIECSCSCKSKKVICKHVIALLYSWINDQEEFTNIGEFIDNLHALDKDRLLAIMKELLIDNPRNFRFFNRSAVSDNDGGVFENDGDAIDLDELNL
ncbi:SWIM zinc finger family protein [candidate division KSB1 bacterium]|nr:SWIM zinc finger family protein [candidate division KSB1 bacterium]